MFNYGKKFNKFWNKIDHPDGQLYDFNRRLKSSNWTSFEVQLQYNMNNQKNYLRNRNRSDKELKIRMNL